MTLKKRGDCRLVCGGVPVGYKGGFMVSLVV